MNLLTQEWISKAEGDFVSAGRELRARKDPNYDSACFHAQQCAEKYLKARLMEANIPFRRSHDLLMLLNLVLPIEPSWQALMPQLSQITIFAVDFRYPGMTADKALAKQAYVACQEVRQVIRLNFGLTP
jgi:HEPN domain-containing protein